MVALSRTLSERGMSVAASVRARNHLNYLPLRAGHSTGRAPARTSR